MIEAALKQYSEAFAAIRNYFDGKLYGSADNMTSSYWRFIEGGRLGTLEFDENPFGEDMEPNYREEAELVCEKHDYSLFYIHDCTGTEYFAILDNSMRIP
jgi:hypothetical protein